MDQVLLKTILQMKQGDVKEDGSREEQNQGQGIKNTNKK